MRASEPNLAKVFRAQGRGPNHVLNLRIAIREPSHVRRERQRRDNKPAWGNAPGTADAPKGEG